MEKLKQFWKLECYFKFKILLFIISWFSALKFLFEETFHHIVSLIQYSRLFFFFFKWTDPTKIHKQFIWDVSIQWCVPEAWVPRNNKKKKITHTYCENERHFICYYVYKVLVYVFWIPNNDDVAVGGGDGAIVRHAIFVLYCECECLFIFSTFCVQGDVYINQKLFPIPPSTGLLCHNSKILSTFAHTLDVRKNRMSRDMEHVETLHVVSAHLWFFILAIIKPHSDNYIRFQKNKIHFCSAFLRLNENWN